MAKQKKVPQEALAGAQTAIRLEGFRLRGLVVEVDGQVYLLERQEFRETDRFTLLLCEPGAGERTIQVWERQGDVWR